MREKQRNGRARVCGCVVVCGCVGGGGDLVPRMLVEEAPIQDVELARVGGGSRALWARQSMTWKDIILGEVCDYTSRLTYQSCSHT